MTDPAVPSPESCLHNLHRAADRDRAPPEPTDLCSTDLGVVHMLDCPLFLGRRCAWYEEAPRPHPETGDAEIAAARDELRRDFLGWAYRLRVRSLVKPRDLVARRIVVEAVATPAEEDDRPIVLRVPVAEGEAAVAVVAVEPAEPTAQPLPPVEAADAPEAATPRASEIYPGQRRSEDRGKRTGRRDVAAATATAEPGSADQAEGDEPDEGDDYEVTAAPTGPRTVEDLLAGLPEASPTDRSHARGRPHDDRSRGPGPGGGRRGHRGRRDRGRGGQPSGGPPHGAGSAPPAAPGDAPAGGGSPGGPRPDGAPRPRRRRRRGRPRGGSSTGAGGGSPPAPQSTGAGGAPPASP